MYLPVEPGRLIRGRKIEDALYMNMVYDLPGYSVSSASVIDKFAGIAGRLAGFPTVCQNHILNLLLHLTIYNQINPTKFQDNRLEAEIKP